MKKSAKFTKNTSCIVDERDIFDEPENRRSLTIPLAFCLSAISFLLLPTNNMTLGESLINKAFNEFPNSILDASASYAVNVVNQPTSAIKTNRKTSLAERVIRYMISQGYQVFIGKGNYNIVYIEGMNLDGKPNKNEPNKFNDLRLAIEVIDGKPRIVKKWEATTEPEIYYTDRPQDVMGAFRIKPGQYTAWEIGYHWGNGGDAQEALVQTKPISGYRDLYKTYKREGKIYTGLYDINQHHGNNLPLDDIGFYGAGCLVGRTSAGHQEFLELLKSDIRYKKNPNFVFTTTLILANSLE